MASVGDILRSFEWASRTPDPLLRQLAKTAESTQIAAAAVSILMADGTETLDEADAYAAAGVTRPPATLVGDLAAAARSRT